MYEQNKMCYLKKKKQIASTQMLCSIKKKSDNVKHELKIQWYRVFYHSVMSRAECMRVCIKNAV